MFFRVNWHNKINGIRALLYDEFDLSVFSNTRILTAAAATAISMINKNNNNNDIIIYTIST